MSNNIKFAFFGSSQFSVLCLEELKTLGILPNLIITTPDKPTGRGLRLSPTVVRVWALKNNIECLSPDKLDPEFSSKLKTYNLPLFLVASYGKIIPKSILDLPINGTLNIHPSLLPKYRGASPLQAQIINDEKEIGITIILLDEMMDHGPVIVQEKIKISDWPIKFNKFEEMTALAGAKLFAKILPAWLEGKIIPTKQNHADATFTKKIKKEDGMIDINSVDPYINYLKFLAYSDKLKVFFYTSKTQPGVPLMKIRVIVKEAEFKDGQFIIKKVLPEGKKEMDYKDFLRGIR